MDSLRIGTFTKSVLLDIARLSGRLEQAGLEVDEISVSSSPAQFRSLISGEYDAIFTSPDNVMAYRFLPANPLGQLLDVEIIAAIDRGLGLSLAVRPGMTDISELRGKRVGVDVPGSGFAFVAYALLARAGLARGDYEIVTLGSTPQRAEALIAGGCDGTVLNAGNELRAERSGCAILGTVADLGPYLGTVVAHTPHAPMEGAVLRLVDVLLGVSREICAGAWKDEVTRSGVRLLGLGEDLAVRHWACLTDDRHGLIPSGVVDTESMQTLIDLRQAYLPAPELGGIMASIGQLVRPEALATAAGR
jgi:hypothetical protein